MATKQQKRASYSHSGCTHCKKLRQKCDEKKPSCTACLNQNQECFYSQHIVMWTPRPKKAQEKKKLVKKTPPAVKREPSPPVKPEWTSPATPSLLSETVMRNIPEWTEYGFQEWIRIMQAYRPTSFTNELEMQQFLGFLFLRVKCGMNYPLGLDDRNPLWKSIMNFIPQFDYLKYAILTVSSNTMELHCRCSEWGPYRRKFMDSCMQSLITKISSYETNDEISTLFATVMILYSDRSASSSNKWRLHLRGALELLRARVPEVPGTDDLFGVLRSWFSMAETLAWMSSPNGGTVSLEFANDILDDSPYAYYVDGLVVDGFNTFKGFSQRLVPYFARATIQQIERKTLGKPVDRDMCLQMVHEIRLLQNEHFALTTVNDPTVKEFMRISHKLHCLALELFIHVILLQENIASEPVQRNTNQVLVLLQQIPLFEALGIVVHWATFMAGRSCMTIEQRGIVEAKLGVTINTGVLVARNSLHRLHRYWDNYDEGLDPDLNDMDSIAF